MKLLLAAVLAAAISAPSAPVEEVPLEGVEQVFAAGETLDYTVTWMKVTGGTGRMTIAPTGEEKDRYRITSVVKSSGSLGKIFKIRDEIETVVSRSDFSTLRYTKNLNERGDKMFEVTVIEDGVATRTRQKVRKLPVPRPILDPISVIYHFRKLDLTPGKTYDITLYADLKLYTVHAKVLRRETITTPAGTFTTVMVEPEMRNAGRPKEEKLHIWYSDDERRLPVRIRTEVSFGSVTATLKSVQTGVTAIDPPPLPR
ncbi:MAG TPA: DUF3108 domain-containing protein [Thermoanaerobaculia bacterium]|nr:DUF3108 domain-containing protein [Thermoanaerobaculia bacterium]